MYPYLVVSDSGLADARREERVLQLLRMVNDLLAKHKETSKRFLSFTVPRVVAVSPQMRLVEDNTSSVSLLDIYKGTCATMLRGKLYINTEHVCVCDWHPWQRYSARVSSTHMVRRHRLL